MIYLAIYCQGKEKGYRRKRQKQPNLVPQTCIHVYNVSINLVWCFDSLNLIGRTPPMCSRESVKNVSTIKYLNTGFFLLFRTETLQFIGLIYPFLLVYAKERKTSEWS